MLTPSYSDLMESIKNTGKVDPRVASRYTVVLAAAKRARQLTEGAEPLTYAPTERAVSIAVKEMHEGKLRVRVQHDLMDGTVERMIKDQYKYRAITALSKDDLREDLKDDYTSNRTYTLEEDEEVNSTDIFQGPTFGDDDDHVADEDLAPQDKDDTVEEFDLFDEDDTEELEDDAEDATEENIDESFED